MVVVAPSLTGPCWTSPTDARATSHGRTSRVDSLARGGWDGRLGKFPAVVRIAQTVRDAYDAAH